MQILFWSGGKDAALALGRLRAARPGRPVVLLTTVVGRERRVSGHGLRVGWIEAQAASLGLPLRRVHLHAGASNAVYEARLEAALGEIVSSGSRRGGAQSESAAPPTLVFGDLHLADLRAWREAWAARLGWRTAFPLWGEDPARLANEFLDTGGRALVVAVDESRLPAARAGQAFDRRWLDTLPPGVDPCGEHGEFHTFVTWAPGFREPIAARPGRRWRRDGFAYCALRPPATPANDGAVRRS